MKKALITGITGQDGSYLAEYLLSLGYEVHGIIRRASSFNTGRIEHVYEDPHSPGVRIFLHYGDLSNSEQLSNLVYNIKPDEVYNLGAQSHVRASFDLAEYTADVTALGATRILEAIRRSRDTIRYYQASSSEMFGDSPGPQNENTPFCPRSPYASAKLYAYWMTRNYRTGYNLYAVNGILFNHESPRRGETFVTRKITRAVAAIATGKQKYLFLGNLNAKRDWGYAPEYVEAMHKMLQCSKAEDVVLGTGESHSVEEFVQEAFSYVDLDWKKYVKIDERYLRPTEVNCLVACADKAKKTISWNSKISFSELVRIMVDADMRLVGLPAVGEGDTVLREKYPKRWWKVD